MLFGIDSNLPLELDLRKKSEETVESKTLSENAEGITVANFYLIDHSLRTQGGHHFDYVRCLAEVSQENGFTTQIGTHLNFAKMRFDLDNELNQLGSVRSVFRDTTYQADSYLSGLQHLTRGKSHQLITDPPPALNQRVRHSFKKHRHHRRREKFVCRFAQDCERFFEGNTHRLGDHAFLTTISELELMGLAVYLANHPETIKTQWHLQFHYNLFEGRTPEYESQSNVAKAVRACCVAALSRLSSHSIHLYTTSNTLADQYNQLEIGQFKSLPYPVAPAFRRPSEPETIRFTPNATETRSESTLPVPIKITCPGEMRREKGQGSYLQSLIDSISKDLLATGLVNIAVQRPKKKWLSTKQKIELQAPDVLCNNAVSQPSIKYYSHPLPDQQYVDLIKTSDCGLLFYDSRAYYSRRAGVLGELLSCGKPVIVPAGSWLAEQIAEPIFEHGDQLIRHFKSARTIGTREFEWASANVPLPGNVLSFDQNKHPFEFSVDREAEENLMILEFDWHWPEAPGTFCRVEVTQRDCTGNILLKTSRVVGHRRNNKKSNAIFEINPDTAVVDYNLSNAFHKSTASIRRAQIRTIKLDPSDKTQPVGAVGIIASDEADLANSVREMVTHFDHYRDSAMQFSKQWRASHEPQATLDFLVGTYQQSNSVSREFA
ncbi:hypothetical protein N9B46_00725 [Mariniblastus sp.]|nr:hypothetical protein [Mariniblastus sp.]